MAQYKTLGLIERLRVGPPNMIHLEAAAEIESLRALVSWQPITTAPLDGSLIDLWIEAVGTRFRATDFIWGGSSWVERISGNTIDQAFANAGMRVTHWMPQPMPPTDA